MPTSTPRAPRGSAKKEAFFREVEAGVQTFALGAVDAGGAGNRHDFRLCSGDIMRGTVQVLPKGFANSLHYHPAYEGFWMVVRGRVRFYGADDAVIGEFGPLEGVFIPRNGRYRFSQVGEEEAHLLQLRGDAREGANRRVDIGERHAAYGKSTIHEIPG